VTGHKHRQFGNLSSTGKVTGNRFKARDGDLMLAVMTEKQFTNLMRALGRPEALEDPRFGDWPSRNRNEKALRAIIEEALAAADAKSWEKRLTAADVPCAAIWPISEIVHHPQLEHRDVLQQIDSAEGRLTLVGSGFRLNEGGGSIDSPPPHLGEHNAEILAQAGYSEAEIAAFREEGVT
jgi:crotonobetainyl-CoA:carnitine CoA-transferase CaiB-like acyl-CoA transferase